MRRALVMLLILPAADLLSAQAPESRGLCFDIGPHSRCSAVMLTEFGAGYRLASNQPESSATLFQYNLGILKNVSPRAGMGGAVFATWAAGAINVGVAPRFRYWVSRRVSFDLAPGLIVFQGGSRNLGLNTQLAANLGPHVALTTTLQMANFGYRHLNQVDWYAGVRLNGRVGVAAGIATPILTFLTYLALFSAHSD